MEVTFVPDIKDFDEDIDEGSDEDSVEDSSKNSNKNCNEHYTIDIHSENSSIFIGYKTDNIIKELFKSSQG